jgi:hypothetical protein
VLQHLLHLAQLHQIARAQGRLLPLQPRHARLQPAALRAELGQLRLRRGQARLERQARGFGALPQMLVVLQVARPGAGPGPAVVAALAGLPLRGLCAAGGLRQRLLQLLLPAAAMFVEAGVWLLLLLLLVPDLAGAGAGRLPALAAAG